MSNFVLRLAWALTISPESIGIVMNPVLFTTILAGIEIARRAQWNLFRLENEQLNNIEKYRAVEVPVPLMVISTSDDRQVVKSVPKNAVSPEPESDEIPLQHDISIDTPQTPTVNRRNAWAV